MAQNIAAAYTEARDKIIQVEQKSKRSGILVQVDLDQIEFGILCTCDTYLGIVGDCKLR